MRRCPATHFRLKQRQCIETGECSLAMYPVAAASGLRAIPMAARTSARLRLAVKRPGGTERGLSALPAADGLPCAWLLGSAGLPCARLRSVCWRPSWPGPACSCLGCAVCTAPNGVLKLWGCLETCWSLWIRIAVARDWATQL